MKKKKRTGEHYVECARCNEYLEESSREDHAKEAHELSARTNDWHECNAAQDIVAAWKPEACQALLLRLLGRYPLLLDDTNYGDGSHGASDPEIVNWLANELQGEPYDT